MPPQASTWTPDRRAVVEKLWGRGFTTREIALELNDRFGMTVERNAVIGLIHRAGFKRPPMRAPDSPTPLPKARPLPRPQPVVKPKPRKPRSPGFLDLDIFDLREGDCRWPHGDHAPYTFCGQPKVEGRSYCAEHHRLGTNPGERRDITKVFQASEP